MVLSFHDNHTFTAIFYYHVRVEIPYRCADVNSWSRDSSTIGGASVMDDNNIKSAREFWKEKTRSVEKTTVTRNKVHGLSSASGKNCDKLDEAKRRNKEELVEVLRQRRQSSNSPEPPFVTSSLSRSHPVRTGKGSSKHDLALDPNLRDRWKRSSVATSRLDVGPTPTTYNRSTSPLPMTSPYKVMSTHDSSAVATKMAERMNSLKKVAVKCHPPLRPAISADRVTPAAVQLMSLKQRPFSSSVDVSKYSGQLGDLEKTHLQPFMEKVNIMY